MSSREQSRAPLGKSASLYKMNKAASMRIQESVRKTSDANRQASRKMSQVRVSRVSVASSRQSVRSTGGSLRSVASFSSRKTRGSNKPQRGTVSSRKGHGVPRKRRRTDTSSSKIHDSEEMSDMCPVPNESNDQFMASNYTYSVVSSEEAPDVTLMASESGIFQKDDKGKTCVNDESSWRFVEYIRSVKNSIFKEAGNTKAKHSPLAEETKSSEIFKQETYKKPPNDFLPERKKGQSEMTSLLKSNSLSVPRNTGKVNVINTKELQHAHRVDSSHTGPSPTKAQKNFNSSPPTVRKLDRKRSSQQLKSPSNQSILSKKTGKKFITTKGKQSEILGPSESINSLNRLNSLSKEFSPITDLKQSNPGIRKSSLKNSKSQISVASSSSQTSVCQEKKTRKVSILASLGSLEDMASSIAQLEREKKLEAIRRLEAVAMEKRRQLADTRQKMRASLEEEILINKKLEGILTKIKLLRRAGEEEASNFDKQTQVFSTRKISD